MSEIKLIFPPHCETGLRGPHLANAQMAGFLADKGIVVETVDLNIRFFRYLTDPDIAPRLLEPALEQFRQMHDEPVLPADQFAHLTDLAQVRPLIDRLRRGTPSESDFWRIVRLLSKDFYHPPMTVSELAAQVEEGPSTLVATFFRSLDFSKLFEGSRVVGISVTYHDQLLPALTLARMIRDFSPSIVIILGGSFLTIQNEKKQEALAALPWLNALIRHEGEGPIWRIAQQLASNGAIDFSRIPGATYQASGEIFHVPIEPAIELNELPQPRFNSQELPRYLSPRYIPILVSKTCYWGKCKFCEIDKFKRPEQAKKDCAIFREAPLIVEDIRTQQRLHGIRDVKLITDAISPDFFRTLANEIIHLRLSVNLTSNCRVDKRQDADFFKLLRKAGVVHLTFGVEAAVDRVLKLMRKGNTLKHVRNNLLWARAADMTTTVNMIPDYPTMEWDEVLASVDFFRDHIDLVSVVNASPFFLSRYSTVFREQEQHGIKALTEEKSEQLGIGPVRFIRTRGLTAGQARQACQLFDRVANDVSWHHRVQPLKACINRRDFNWRRSQFQLTGEVQGAWLPFDPSSPERGTLLREEKPVFVATSHDLQRHLTLPNVGEEIFRHGVGGEYFAVDDILRYMTPQWKIHDRNKVALLIWRCLLALIEEGMILRVRC